MKSTVPPIDPGQLPPDTEDHLFINATPEIVGPVVFDVDGGGGPITVDHVPPATTVVVRAPMPVQSNHVTCYATVNGQNWTFDFGDADVPGGFWVSSLHCGLRAGRDGGYVPFALAIVRDPNAAQVIALDQ